MLFRSGSGLFHKPNPEPIQLTAGPSDIVAPLPSRDGKRLFVMGYEGRPELVRYDARGQQFIPLFSGIQTIYPDFSRDGQWVAYKKEPEMTIWRSKVDGTDRRQLSFAPLFATLPHWSPDGKQIAFLGQAPGASFKIYIVPSEGGNTERLETGEFIATDPTWSGDGSALAWSDAYWGSSPEARKKSAIHMINLKTRQVSTLPGPAGLLSPHWSPDGRYLAAASADSEKLLLYDFETKQWGDLAKITVGYWTWSADSRYVYAHTTGPDSAVVRVNIGDHKIEPVVSLKDYRTNRPWCGLTPDGSPLLLHELGTAEIYALDWEAP